MSDYKLSGPRKVTPSEKDKTKKCLSCNKEDLIKNLTIRSVNMGDHRAIGFAHREGECL